MNRLQRLPQVCLAIALCSSVSFASAQQVAQPAAAAGLQILGVLAPADVLDLGARAVAAVDAGQYAGLWAQAAPSARARMSDADFIQVLTDLRRSVGAPSRRLWVNVSLQNEPGAANVASGVYATTSFQTTFSIGGTRIERLSFRLEEGGRWRFTGYTLQN